MNNTADEDIVKEGELQVSIGLHHRNRKPFENQDRIVLLFGMREYIFNITERTGDHSMIWPARSWVRTKSP